MTSEQLNEIKNISKKEMGGTTDLLHTHDHVLRVVENAKRIVKILKLENEVDVKLLEAACLLHDIAYAEKSGVAAFVFEPRLAKSKLAELLPNINISEAEKEILVTAIEKHPHAVPFRRLNKDADIYTQILQDADTLDIFSIERVGPLENRIWFYKELTTLWRTYGKNSLEKYLNFPEIAPHFLEEYEDLYQPVKLGKGVNLKAEKWFLKKYEDRFLSYVVPLMPKKIETYHLTSFTLLWSILVLVSGYLATTNILWFLGVPILMILQYTTDMLDGSVGRHRDTGLVKWGYYMDHVLDFVFMTCIFAAYLMISPNTITKWVMLLYVLVTGSMVTEYLTTAATGKFSISFKGFGVSELRLIAVAFNVAIALNGPAFLTLTAPPLVIAFSIIFVIRVYLEQKKLWTIDMEIKRNKVESERS